jgi:hypothetical protein
LLTTGAANARLAVFVGTPGADILFHRLSAPVLRVRGLGTNDDRLNKPDSAAGVIGYSNETPSFFPSLQITLQNRVPASPSMAS